jgi:hypothetical protein
MGVGRVYIGKGFASCRSFDIVLLVVVFICLLSHPIIKPCCEYGASSLFRPPAAVSIMRHYWWKTLRAPLFVAFASFASFPLRLCAAPDSPF